MKRFFGVLFVLALTLALSGQRPASAQSVFPGNQRVTGGTHVLTFGNTATVCTAVAGKAITVKALRLSSTEAVTVQFYSGAAPTTPVGGPIPLDADVAVTLNEDFFGRGLGSTATGATLTLSTNVSATLTVLARVQED